MIQVLSKQPPDVSPALRQLVGGDFLGAGCWALSRWLRVLRLGVIVYGYWQDVFGY